MPYRKVVLMNRIAETVANFLGSTPVVVGFGLWTLAHAFLSQDYVSTISDLAILVGLLILRAESVQAERTERNVKQDVRLSKEVLKRIKK